MTIKNNTLIGGGGYKKQSLLSKKLSLFSIFLIVLLGLSLLFVFACKEPDDGDDNGTPPVTTPTPPDTTPDTPPVKTNPTVTWPTGLTAEIGQTLADVAITGGTGDGTFTWTTPTDSVGEEGPQTHNMTFTPDDTATYNILYQDVTIDVIDPNKDTPVIDISPTAAPITYGAALSTSTLSGGSASFGGTTVTGSFAWTNGEIIPTVENSGYDVTFTPDDTAIYNKTTGTVQITVSKADPEITAWPVAAPINYGAALSTSALSGGASSPDGTFAWTDGGTIPTVANSGYEVTFTPTDAANYNTATNTVAIAVNKANPNVTWPSGLTATAGQTLATVSLAGKGTGDGTFTWTNPTAPVGVEGQRTHNMTFTPTDTANYNTLTNDVTVTVTPQLPYAIALSPSGTYAFDAVDPGYNPIPPLDVLIENIGTGGTGPLTIALSGNNADSFTLSSNTHVPIAADSFGAFTVKPDDGLDAGDYTAVITVTDTIRLTVATLEVSFTVNPIFTNAAQLAAYLAAATGGAAPDDPIQVILNVSGDTAESIGNIIYQYRLNGSNPKHISLDMFGSTFNGIENNAFDNCSNLVSVTIPDSVESIGSSAFSGCSGLVGITIPDGVNSIGASAFQDCSGLESVTIPDRVNSIGQNAFSGCTNLRNITIETSRVSNSSSSNWGHRFPADNLNVTFNADIGQAAFNSCTRLISVTIGNSVESIGQAAFSNCTSLTGVTIGNSVTSIGSSAFSGCDNLNAVTIGNSVESIGDYAFSGCDSLTGVTIPDSVESIGQDAFSYTGLTSVTIGNRVTSIGQSAFSYCTSLTAINVNAANTAYSSENGVLYNKDKTTIITYPIGKTAASFTIPDSVISIVSYAFYGCSNLTGVTIPDSVTGIGNFAFASTGLAGVTIPDSVESIGNSAFRGCTRLTSVTIGNSVNSIGDYAFYSCNVLASVTFESTGTNIADDNSFPGDLRSKYISGGIGTYTRASGGTVWTKQ